MEESNRFEVLIIGAGQAGIPLAHDLAKAGKRVGLIEEKYLGGSCVNFGCTPTKAVIASARIAHLAHRAKEFGLNIPTVEIDFPAVLERATRILMDSRKSLQQRFEKNVNPKLLCGSARFDGSENGSFRVTIGDRLLVGMTESEAKRNRKPIKVAHFEMKANGRAREFGETEGFIKVIIETKSNRILGATVLASEGAELVHMYADLMNANAPYTVIRDAIYIHPTLAEAVQSALNSFESRG
jgi:pyruvate/2-oxoglutarate dehydrogenase complex dihydrolipoamide dehydrogenase (E3) component